jgi:hypothetical protein
MAKKRVVVNDPEKIRETMNEVWLAKSRFRQGLIKRLAKGQDQKNEALIPNETNKVRSHKNYPKYLEYNIIIHVGIMYKI